VASGFPQGNRGELVGVFGMLSQTQWEGVWE
jgi:hypothetical protein